MMAFTLLLPMQEDYDCTAGLRTTIVIKISLKLNLLAEIRTNLEFIDLFL
jgi:hypothetical protein